MNSDKVSVIIPCFNAEKYIIQTINSVLKQTHKNIEIIVVDDHSTDNSFSKALIFSRKYPHIIKVIKNSGNGACAARNLGFQFSQGDYIQYLDADDLISPEKLKKQVEILENNATKIAVCNTFHFYNSINDAYNTDLDFIFSTYKPEEFLMNLWGANGKTHYVAVHSYLTPRLLIEKAGAWNEKLYKDQDGEFFARVILESDGILYVPEIKSYYRKHNSSLNTSSQKKRQHIKSNLLATVLKEQYLFSKTKSKKAQLAMAAQYKHVAIEAWPQYRDISNIAQKKCKHLGGTKYSPILGGRSIEILKKTFGWKVAKAASYYGHNNRIIKHLFSMTKH